MCMCVCARRRECESCNIVCSPMGCGWANSINSHSPLCTPPPPQPYTVRPGVDTGLSSPLAWERHRERKQRMKCLREVLQCVGYLREQLQEMHCVRKCVVVRVCGHMFRCALERIKSLCGKNASVRKTEVFTCCQRSRVRVCVCVCMHFLWGWHVSVTGVFCCKF